MISKEQFYTLSVGNTIKCTRIDLYGFTKGKDYTIVTISKNEKEITVVNDNGLLHYLTLNNYIKHYFEIPEKTTIVPVDDVSICLIEINQCIKIQQNKVHAEERVLKTLEEAKRLLSKK